MADAAVETPLAVRLLNGAKVLGQLWRAGGRCGSGWELACLNKLTKFCSAKTQWLAIAVQAGRELPEIDSPFALVEMMTVNEFDASGLTVEAEIAGVGRYKIGARGAIRMSDIVKLVTDPAGIASVFRVIDGFPGSKVVKVEEPVK